MMKKVLEQVHKNSSNNNNSFIQTLHGCKPCNVYHFKLYTMKKKNIYTLSVILFCAAVVGIMFKYDHRQTEEKNKVYVLLQRKGTLANSEEWKQAKRTS